MLVVVGTQSDIVSGPFKHGIFIRTFGHTMLTQKFAIFIRIKKKAPPATLKFYPD